MSCNTSLIYLVLVMVRKTTPGHYQSPLYANQYQVHTYIHTTINESIQMFGYLPHSQMYSTHSKPRSLYQITWLQFPLNLQEDNTLQISGIRSQM